MNDALGVLEFSSIPSGYRTYNRIIKDVEVDVLRDIIIAPGKLVIMFGGSYGAVSHALEWAIGSSAEGILDYSLIGNVNADLAGFLAGGVSDGPGGGAAYTDIGVIEADTVAAGIEKANSVLHGTPVGLTAINYSVEMHGKCLIVIGGSISAVSAALEAAGSGELVSNVEPAVLRSIIGKTEATGESNG